MPATPPSAAETRVRLRVESLACGMFVAELDRPWLDTPFLLEGLLLREQAELSTLRRYCQFVYVDLERSTGAAADAVRRAARRQAAARASIRKANWLRGIPRAGAPSRNDLQPPGMSAVARLLERVRARRAVSAAPEASETAPAPRPAPPELQLPPGLRLAPYAAPLPMEAGLPKATEAWSRGASTLHALMDDLRDDARGALRNIDQVADELVGTMVESPDAMLWVARLRDEHRHTYHHGLKVAIYLVALGRHMGFPREDLARLGLIGMLADAGKTRLPRALIEKPGMLTPAEYAVARKHVPLGLAALRKVMALDPLVEQGILQHHERIDGSGYPQGLKGKEIGIYGRMAAIADCFAALITDRPYAKAIAPQDALMQMYQWSGVSFHEPLVEQFVQAIGIFPVGTLVELSNHEVAIVLAHNRVRRLEPRVLVLTQPDKTPLDEPFERDLLLHPLDCASQPIRIACGLPVGAYGLEPRDYYAAGAAPAHEPALTAA